MVHFGVFVYLEGAELHRCVTGSGFIGNTCDSPTFILQVCVLHSLLRAQQRALYPCSSILRWVR